MEIQNDLILLSPDEISAAESAVTYRPQNYTPEFSQYVGLLLNKAHEQIQGVEIEFHSAATVSVPYRKDMVEFLMNAVKDGKDVERERAKEFTQKAQRTSDSPECLRRQYAKDERERRKRRFRVVE